MTPKCKPREGKETIYPEKGRRYLLKNCNKAPREANGVPFYTPQMNSKSLITKKTVKLQQSFSLSKFLEVLQVSKITNLGLKVLS